MKKTHNKLTALILCLILIIPSVSLFSFADDGEIQLLHLVEDETLGGLKNYHYEDEDGNIVTDEKQVKLYSGAKRKVSSSQLPSSYSSIDEGYATPVRTQGSYNICWAYSALEAVGIYNRKNFGISYDDSDYSEMHFNYFKCTMPKNSSDPLYGDGENDEVVLSGDGEYLRTGHSVLMRGSGLVAETTFPYSTDVSTVNNISEDYRYSQECGLVTSAENISNSTVDDIQLLKQEIIEHGAVQITYYHLNSYFNDGDDGYCYYSNKSAENNTNHAVIILGWDDNFSKSNFLSTNQPSSDGAWLCQNSWGSKWGDDGYFWMSYEEDATEVTTFTAVQNGTYDKIYQYEGYNSYSSTANMSFYNVPSKYTTKQACIYTADENNILEAFNYYTTGPCNLTCSVYRNITDKSNPESGTLCYENTYTKQYEGYSIFEFSNAITLNEGETYSIVIQPTVASGYSTYRFPQCGVNAFNTANEGESFYYSWESNGWVDGSVGTVPSGKSYTVGLGDAPIKVYACYEKVLNFKESDIISLQFGEEETLNYENNFKVQIPEFTSSDSNIVSVDSTGKIKALNCGTVTITVKCGNLEDSITVNVPHEYGEWETKVEATSTETGLSERKCINCDHIDSCIIPITSTLTFIKYRENISVGYRTTVILGADVTSGDSSVYVMWINEKGSSIGFGNTIKFEEMEENVTVRPVLIKNGSIILDPNKQMTIEVKNGFFDKVVWFFKNLFNSSSLIENRT